MSKIFIQKVGVEQTVTFELDSGLEVTAVLIVQAHVEDSGIGAYECHGSMGNDVRLGREIDEIDIQQVFIYIPDFNDYAVLQDTSFEPFKMMIENRIEITQEIEDDYET